MVGNFFRGKARMLYEGAPPRTLLFGYVPACRTSPCVYRPDFLADSTAPLLQRFSAILRII